MGYHGNPPGKGNTARGAAVSPFSYETYFLENAPPLETNTTHTPMTRKLKPFRWPLYLWAVQLQVSKATLTRWFKAARVKVRRKTGHTLVEVLAVKASRLPAEEAAYQQQLCEVREAWTRHRGNR
jgi:hypothetical protein